MDEPDTDVVFAPINPRDIQEQVFCTCDGCLTEEAAEFHADLQDLLSTYRNLCADTQNEVLRCQMMAIMSDCLADLIVGHMPRRRPGSNFMAAAMIQRVMASLMSKMLSEALSGMHQEASATTALMEEHQSQSKH